MKKGLGPQRGGCLGESRHSTPGHTGLEEQSVPKGSIRAHIKCDIKGDLELEKGDSDKNRREETIQLFIN